MSNTINTEYKTWKQEIFNPEAPLKGIPTLAGHTMTQIGSDMYIFGGRSGYFSYSNDLYKIDTNTGVFSKLDTTGDVPSPRQNHIAIAINNNTQLFVHGGSDGSNRFSDTFLLNLDTLTWTKAASAPVVSEGHAAVLSYKKDSISVYVFGGLDGSDYLTSIRIFNVGTGEWSSLGNGPARALFSASKIGQYVYFFGGLNSNGFLGTHDKVFSLSSHSWVEKSFANAPASRQGHCAIVYHNDIYIWGGNAGSFSQFKDLWALNTQPRRPGEEIDNRAFSILIEDALVRANSIIEASSIVTDEQSNVEGDAQAVLQKDYQFEELIKQIPAVLRRCHEIEALNKEITNTNDQTRTTVAQYVATIELEKNRYIKQKESISQVASALREKLDQLRAAEQKFHEAERASLQAKDLLGAEKKSLEGIQNELKDAQVAIANFEAILNRLQIEEKGINDKLKHINSILSGPEQESTDLEKQKEAEQKIKDDIVKDIQQAEKILAEKKEEASAISLRLIETEDRLRKIKNLKSEAGDVKAKLVNSLRADEDYDSAKKRFIGYIGDEDALKNIFGDDEATIERKRKEQEWLDQFISNQTNIGENDRRELTEQKKKVNDHLDQLNKDLDKLKTKEAQSQQKIDRINEKLQTRNIVKQGLIRDKEVLQAKLEDISTEQNRTRENLNEQQQIANQKQSNVTAILDAMENHKRNVTSCKVEEDEATRQLNTIQDALNEQFLYLKENIDEANGTKNKLDNTRRSLTAAKSSLEARISDASKTRDQLKAEMAALNEMWANKAKQCEAEKEALKLEIEQLKKQLNAAQQPSSVNQTTTVVVEELTSSEDLI